MPRRDVFISHASEDKDTIARPLAEQLRADGCSVWFDEYELVLGDSLRTKVGAGLQDSRVGVVILSRSFFAKQWPQWELDGLTARHIAGEQNVILPVWHEVGLDDVRSYSLPLADLLAAKSSDGVPAVADAIVRVLSKRAAGGEPKAALYEALVAGSSSAWPDGAAELEIDDAVARGSPDSRRRRHASLTTRLVAFTIAAGLIAVAVVLLATHLLDGAGGEGSATSSTQRTTLAGPPARHRTASVSVPRSGRATFMMPSGSVRIEWPRRNEVARCWRFQGDARLRAGRTLMIGARRVDPPSDRTYFQRVTWNGTAGRSTWGADRHFGTEVGQTYRVSVVAIAKTSATENLRKLPRSAEIRWLSPSLLHKLRGPGNCKGADGSPSPGS